MIIIRSRHPSHKPLRKAKIKSNHKRVVYRLGSIYQGKYDAEINSVQSIQNSSSKFKMKKLFEKAGVKSTKFYIDPKEITNKTKFPLIAKLNFGSRGEGMKFLESFADFQNFMKNKYNQNYYFEEYFAGCREYRIHYCMKFGAFYSCRKMRKNNEKERWYFNSKNCVWINQFETQRDANNKFIAFKDKEQKLFNKPKTWDSILEHVKKATEAIGLDIATVDVRVDSKGNFVILETNSAPGLAEIGTKIYIDLLTKLGKTF